MRSLAIIESPFQLLSLVEAKNYFKINDLTVIIKYTNNPKTNNQIDWMLNHNSFTKVIKLPKFNKITLNDFVLIFLIFKWKLSQKKFNHIFIGEPRSLIMTSFLLNFKYLKYYFLDDGSVTIVLQNKVINDDLSFYEDSEKSLINTFRKIVMKVLGIKYTFKQIPTFFSCFNLNAVKNQEIIKHNFENISQLVEVKEINILPKVYFIGGNLSEGKAMQEVFELELFTKIVKYYKKKGQKIIYCCHRRESSEKLEKIKKIDPTLELYFPEFPIELEFIIKKISIQNIGSYCSTALYTSTLIFKPKESIMFKIPSEYLLNQFKKEFQDLEINYTDNKFIQLEKEYSNS